MRIRAPIFRLLTPVLLGLLLTACAAVGSSRKFTAQTLVDMPNIPQMVQIENVPFMAQEDKYCGPAALAMVSTWLDRPMTQEDAAVLVYTPERQGTLQIDMLTAARRLGFLAIQSDVPETAFIQLAQGRPIIVFLNLGLGIMPVWHYAVLKGYDLEKRTVTLHSGLNENEEMALDTFLRSWARTKYWSMTLTYPDKLPEGVSAQQVQQSILGFEQLTRYELATTAYEAALVKWPKDFSLRMGYANLLYSQENYKGAEKQFMQAWKYHSKSHAPLNNITYALLKQQCYTNAVHAAREALWLAPEKDKPAVQKTLDEALTYLGKPEGRSCARQPTIR